MKTTEDEVVAFRIPGLNEPYYKVRFDGQVQRPDFNSKGAALAFLRALINGTRQPEPIANH